MPGRPAGYRRICLLKGHQNHHGLPFQLNMVIRKDISSQLEGMLRLAIDLGANAAEVFGLVAAGRAKNECRELVLSLEERKVAVEQLAEAQEDYPIVIGVPGCPMYPLILQEKNIKPKHFPAEMLRRIPYLLWKGLRCWLPMGYLMVLSNGEVDPRMPLQASLGNISASRA